MPRSTTCPSCNRSSTSGRTYTVTAQCSSCHGTGKVCRICHRSQSYCSCDPNRMNSYMYANRLQSCGSCGGTGRARVQERCNNPYNHTGR